MDFNVNLKKLCVGGQEADREEKLDKIRVRLANGSKDKYLILIFTKKAVFNLWT